jgi:hypothetical protein
MGSAQTEVKGYIMSSKSYASKARTFKISNPTDPASDGQRKQIGRLLRFKAHNVEFGNMAVEALSGPMTRHEADQMIKALAKCKNVSQSATEARKAGVKAAEQVIAASKPQAQIDWQALCLNGKLGKVAQNKARALVA